jgi:ubiquinone/menaquinone biosynthesis C-methylase UbiE
MGYIFDFNATRAYDTWCRQPQNQTAIGREMQLMSDLLAPMRGRSVLDIGCGAGAGLRTFLNAGLSVTGLDPSTYMLDIASRTLGDKADLHRGVAEALPFEDNEFHYACFVKTLEFVDDFEKSLQEACRVTKDRLFIGIINRYALSSTSSGPKMKSLPPQFENAHFFSLWEIKKVLRGFLGDVPIAWQALWSSPQTSPKITEMITHSSWLKQIPFGMYIGLVVTLCPRFKTRPLAMTCTAKHGTGALIG